MFFLCSSMAFLKVGSAYSASRFTITCSPRGANRKITPFNGSGGTPPLKSRATSKELVQLAIVSGNLFSAEQLPDPIFFGSFLPVANRWRRPKFCRQVPRHRLKGRAPPDLLLVIAPRLPIVDGLQELQTEFRHHDPLPLICDSRAVI